MSLYDGIDDVREVDDDYCVCCGQFERAERSPICEPCTLTLLRFGFTLFPVPTELRKFLLTQMTDQTQVP